MGKVVEAFRSADIDHGDRWIWYGPAGVDGDCATEVVVYTPGSFLVREYQYVEGYLEDYEKETPFLCTEVYIEYEGGPCVAARIGANQIAQSGGTESWHAELPQ